MEKTGFANRSKKFLKLWKRRRIKKKQLCYSLNGEGEAPRLETAIWTAGGSVPNRQFNGGGHSDTLSNLLNFFGR